MITPAAAALEYIRRGWSVVPVGYKEKECYLDAWQHLRITPDDVPRYFTHDKQNIGALAGEPSSGRVDVDLDVPEAVAAGALLLPPTDLIHVRASNPNSHRWYAAEGAVTYRNWQFSEHDRDKATTLAELRANGRQTLVPPSVHPTGEAYRWEQRGAPGKVSAETLTALAARTAAAALIARHCPAKAHAMTPHWRSQARWCAQAGQTLMLISSPAPLRLLPMARSTRAARTPARLARRWPKTSQPPDARR